MTTQNAANDDIVGREPEALFKLLATTAGVIREGDPLDRNVIDLCYAVVESCARVAELVYTGHDDRVGDVIRANLGDA